ncbi:MULTISPECIES: hypothetical protein [Aquitalea]|uniref:Uncharacterized protein n=1 Tax=Aquitalea magnusonii TaxID=332411 RepID=A0A318J5Z4_9NEIS|nr:MULTISPECIES: hypothetical protein [Aquitalea]PXX42860.1 hypothetical protein DFR38_11767 [Aquitalea magnusonii]
MTMNAQQKKLLLIGTALLLLAAIKGGLVWWYLQHKNQPAAPQLLACNIAQGRCALPDGGSLHFVSPPQNGKPFTLRLEGVQVAQPAVEFAMADMDMGFNRYRFVADGSDWQARITLPVCATGSRHWIATLHLGEQSYSLPFLAQ